MIRRNNSNKNEILLFQTSILSVVELTKGEVGVDQRILSVGFIFFDSIVWNVSGVIRHSVHEDQMRKESASFRFNRRTHWAQIRSGSSR